VIAAATIKMRTSAATQMRTAIYFSRRTGFTWG
jgi:hypothetical protein